MTELPEIPREEVVAETRDQPDDQGGQELPLKPTQDNPMIIEDQEVIAEREGVHERIQAEIQQGDKEAERGEEVMLETPPAQNAVPDLESDNGRQGRTHVNRNG